MRLEPTAAARIFAWFHRKMGHTSFYLRRLTYIFSHTGGVPLLRAFLRPDGSAARDLQPWFRGKPFGLPLVDGSGRQHPFICSNGWRPSAGSSACTSFFLMGRPLPYWRRTRIRWRSYRKRFDTLEEMRKITFNLHQMMPLDTPIEDDSEADIRYVYAVKPVDGNLPVGAAVLPQTISYVVWMRRWTLAPRCGHGPVDGLPVVMLALYAKIYLPLRFYGIRFPALNKKQMKGLVKSQKRLMLEFEAFRDVAPTPANSFALA